MRELEYPFDPGYIMKKRRSIKKELLKTDKPFVEKRIAVLGGSTTHDIIDILELFLLNYGIRPTFYESEFNQYWQDAMFDNPKLDEFKPEIIFIHTSSGTSQSFRLFPMTRQRSAISLTGSMSISV